MCGRYRLTRADLLAAALDATPQTGAPFEEFTEKGKTLRLEFKPADYVPIVHLQGTRRVIDVAYWGFIPSWAGGDAKVKPINAKSETAARSGMFRSAFKSGRCLIPADGFFEPKGPKGMKHRPQFYFQRPDHAIFAFAGLWSYRDDSQTCVLLTTTPNGVVAPIHNRMPVILSPADYGKWLDLRTTPEELQQLLRPSPDQDLMAEPEIPAKPAEPTLFDMG
jgi:putative SOS response-associated peptidase YedK